MAKKKTTGNPNPISNHIGQKEVWYDFNRFKVVISGRRWGKTLLAREKLVQSSTYKSGNFWYIAPTRGHAKDLLWEDLKNRFDQLKWKYKKDETELSIKRLRTNTKITLKSAETYDRLRGKGLNGVIFDEVADIEKKAWTEAVRPALSDKLGWAMFLGTPKGMNWVYDLAMAAKSKKNWALYEFKTIDSPFFQTPEGQQEIEDARLDLDEITFRQEYEASFENFSGRVCYAFDRRTNHSDYKYDNATGIIVGMDFNVLPMSACLFQRVSGKLIQFGELAINTSNTDEMCREIYRQFPNNNIIVRPDASGKNRYTSASRSDFEIIRSHGYNIEVDLTNPKRVDRWASQNRAYEKQLAMINTIKCPKTTKDLETLCYKEGTCEPDLKGILHGHLFDANGYAIFKEFPIRTIRRSSIIQL